MCMAESAILFWVVYLFHIHAYCEQVLEIQSSMQLCINGVINGFVAGVNAYQVTVESTVKQMMMTAWDTNAAMVPCV